ncbi:MAG TPA: choice-of-anchor tandem repeat GloVer-containing protein, partial [Terriglobales bacterium]|nr:choice-of-anchor tandem repeat GloVer-containing protein [Terriglobales bacterium]
TTTGHPWAGHVLYTFTGQTDGMVPWAGLTWHSGNLYGAATAGGVSGPNGGGTVFELTPSDAGWTFNLIYSFPGWGISGTYRDLYIDKSGNIWATTHCDGADTDGTVYELSPPTSGSTWTYTLLWDITDTDDGYYLHTNLVFDQQGNLYGTAEMGGQDGFGTVFKVTP